MVSPDFIVLHDADNVATAMRDVEAGGPAGVAGAHGGLPGITPATSIPLGHKIATRDIASGDLVVKHVHPIGRATVAIAAGEHVHVHNVTSLSRETDILPPESV